MPEQDPQHGEKVSREAEVMFNHGVAVKTGRWYRIYVGQTLKLENAVWSQLEAKVGDEVKLTFDVPGRRPKGPIKLEIWEHDLDGQHDLIKTFEVPEAKARIEHPWTIEKPPPEDDTSELARLGDVCGTFFFVAKCDEKEQKGDDDVIEVSSGEEDEKLLKLKPILGKLKMRFADEDDIALSYLPYTVRTGDTVRGGYLDENGLLEEDELPLGKVEVKVHGLEPDGVRMTDLLPDDDRDVELAD